MPESEWLSWDEAAALAGCPVPTVDWWKRQGRIKSRGGTGRPSLDRGSVEEFALWYRQREKERAEARLRPKKRKRNYPARPELPPEPTGWLTPRQVGERIGRSEVSVGWLIRQGRLPAASVGRRRWVRETDAEAYKVEMDRWVTYEEAAVILGISKAAVWPLVKAGTFKQRGPAGTKLPSLDRASVKRFASDRDS